MRAILTLAIIVLSLHAVAAEQPFSIDAPGQREVLVTMASLLESRYVDADRGRVLAEGLRRGAESGRWAHLDDPEEFAEELTRYLRQETGDGHLGLDFSAEELPEDNASAEEAYNEAETERWYGAHLNYGFERIERLDGNIGYLDLRVFAPTMMAGDVAAAAMTLLAQSQALIIDLRRNGGGHGEMSHLIMAYLLDGSREVSGAYNRPRDERTHAMTPAWVPGRHYGGTKPVYVLISKRTFSAAEGFAYDLQALGRAVVVGEPSGGGAHPFEYRRVHPHFVLSLAEGRSINPVTGGNWQGTGVIPDVQVPAEDALRTALKLARAEKTMSQPQ